MSPSAALLLAAGEARRFGAPKLLLPFGEGTVIGSVVAALGAAGVAPIVVVAGAQAEEIAAALGEAARVVRNPDPSRGMVSSVQVGVAALPEGVGSFFIALGDQPRVRAADLLAMRAAQEQSGKGLVMPTYRGKRGHPVLVSGRYREEILRLTEEQTLRDFLHAHFEDTLEVACESDAVISDIDTREQYEHERRKSRK